VVWRLPVALGNGGGRPTANLLAVNTVWGVAEAKKEDLWSLCAFTIAWK